jgi:hypothetical protein
VAGGVSAAPAGDRRTWTNARPRAGSGALSGTVTEKRTGAPWINCGPAAGSIVVDASAYVVRSAESVDPSPTDGARSMYCKPWLTAYDR